MANALEEKLLHVMKFGSFEEVKKLLAASDLSDRIEALQSAIKNGNQEIATIFITAGAYVDLNILSLAADIGWADTVRAALDNGLDAKLYINFALWRAAYNGHAEIVEMLIAAGADVQGMSDDVIRNAVKAERVRIVEILVLHCKTDELDALQSELQSPLLTDVIARQRPRGLRTKAALRDPRPTESDI